MNENKEYKYTYVNGDTVTLKASELPEKWIRILERMDHEERKNDRNERRRHLSLQALDPNSNYLTARRDGLNEMQHRATWQWLRKHISEREADIAEAYFMYGYTTVEIAREYGISFQAVSKTITHTQKKLKKLKDEVEF